MKILPWLIGLREIFDYPETFNCQSFSMKTTSQNLQNITFGVYLFYRSNPAGAGQATKSVGK